MLNLSKYLALGVAVFLLACNSPKKKESHDHGGHDHAHHEHDHDHDHDHGSDSHDGHDHDEELGDNEVGFTRKQAELISLQLEVVSAGVFSEIIKTSGQLVAPLGQERVVVAPSSGVLSFSSRGLSVGSPINAGQQVARVSAKNLAEGDPVDKIAVQYELARKEYERMSKLLVDSLVSQVAYNEARLAFETAKISYDALSGRSGGSGISIASQTAGFIKNLLVEDGAYVSVGQPIMTVAQSKRIQLKADVSERYAQQLAYVSGASFATSEGASHYDMVGLNGRLVSYGRSMGETSFYLPVIFEFDNTGNFLPGSYVEVYLKTRPLEQTITVPLSAVVEEQGLHFVYVKIKDEVYLKKEIRLGPSDGLRAQVFSGLEVGEKLVTTGAYHLKLASMSSAIPHGHSH